MRWMVGVWVVCAATSSVSAQEHPSFDELTRAFEQERGGVLARANKLKALVMYPEHRDADCVAYLDRVRRRDDDEVVRLLALRLIGVVGGEAAVDVLERVIQRGPEDQRASAVRGLSHVDPPVGAQTFVDLVRDRREDGAVRLQAARALSAYPEARAAEALAELLDALDGDDDDQRLRNTATTALRAQVADADVAQWFLQTALGRRTPYRDGLRDLLRVAPACALGSEADRAALAEGVERMLRGRGDEVQAAAAAALGTLHAGAGAAAQGTQDALVARLRDRDERVIVETLVALGRIGPTGTTVAALVGEAEGRDAGRRVAALGALEGVEDPEVLRVALGAVAERDVAPVSAGVVNLAYQRDPQAVDALLGVLEAHPVGRLADDAVAALEVLTGASLGHEVGPWRGWWEAVRGDFDFPAPGAEAAEQEGATQTRELPQYYGMSVTSRRVVFVVDGSASMRETMEWEGTSQGTTRLSVCQGELRRVLMGLESEVRFNVLRFSDGYEPWQRRVTEVSQRSREHVLEFVNRMEASGGTNLYDPLAWVLEDANVDTVYVLSDGSPTSGTFTDAYDILRELRVLNATRRVRFHVILVGRESAWLRELASETGGVVRAFSDE